MMKISLLRSYRSDKGNPVFVYTVSGSSADLKAFKSAQGEYYREGENKAPLWFTTRCVGQQGKLIITENGKVVPDMSAFDQAASLVAQYGGNFGAELAKGLVANLMGGGATPTAEKPAEAPKSSTEDMGKL